MPLRTQSSPQLLTNSQQSYDRHCSVHKTRSQGACEVKEEVAIKEDCPLAALATLQSMNLLAGVHWRCLHGRAGDCSAWPSPPWPRTQWCTPAMPRKQILQPATPPRNWLLSLASDPSLPDCAILLQDQGLLRPPIQRLEIEHLVHCLSIVAKQRGMLLWHSSDMWPGLLQVMDQSICMGSTCHS